MYLRRSDGVRHSSSEPSLPFFSTSRLGNDIKDSGVLQNLGYYIVSSNGFPLCTSRHPKSYYLFDSSNRKCYEIPCPRVQFREICMSLITEDCHDKELNRVQLVIHCLKNQI